MGVNLTTRVWVQLDGTWTDLTQDVLDAPGLSCRYGIQGSGPVDVVAGSGELSFTLKNHTGNSAGLQGYYSPSHTNKRAGWTFGVAVRVVMRSPVHPTYTVSTLTRVDDVATLTLDSDAAWTAGMWAWIQGAAQSAYNGLHRVASVVSPGVYTFDVPDAPATPATGTITAQRACVRFTGRVHAINPLPGAYRSQVVQVKAYDLMRDLAEADLRTVPIQVDQSESDLMGTLLDALPVTAQPLYRDLSPGVDIYPYAFDDLSSGTKALSVVARVARSAMAAAFVAGDGTFVLQSRHWRAVEASRFSFDNSMQGLTVPSSLEMVYSVVRVTVHPRTIDPNPTSVLFEQQGAPPAVKPGETLTIWATYTDPADRTASVGGLDIVAPVAGTDYVGNSAADGSGSDLTADLSVTVDAFASAGKIAVTNTGSTVAYPTTLQVRGRGVYDHAPQTVEATSAQPYGAREIGIDLEYQGDSLVARDAAEFITAQYSSLASQPVAIVLEANHAETFMRAALELEVGQRITVTETVTGLSAVEAVVQSVQFSVRGQWLTVRFGLAPASPWRFWQMGTVGASEMGVTTVVGF